MILDIVQVKSSSSVDISKPVYNMEGKGRRSILSGCVAVRFVPSHASSSFGSQTWTCPNFNALAQPGPLYDEMLAYQHTNNLLCIRYTACAFCSQLCVSTPTRVSFPLLIIPLCISARRECMPASLYCPCSDDTSMFISARPCLGDLRRTFTSLKHNKTLAKKN